MITAHQRQIREEMTVKEPRAVAQTLHGYSVETISRADATPIIMHYEWLKNIGRANHFIGLLSPEREIHGVACFGPGPAARIINGIIGGPALCLERGACVHYAPPNAASFLINHACKLIYRITGVARFFAYGDPMAGEYGAVYQAANWLYLGQGLDGNKGRKHRAFFLAPGKSGDDPKNWKTSRDLRRGKLAKLWDHTKSNGKYRTSIWQQARNRGWRIAWRGAKHVYAINVGSDRKRWRKDIAKQPRGLPLPFPAPHPELKRKFQPVNPTFRIPSPDYPQSDLFGEQAQAIAQAAE